MKIRDSKFPDNSSLKRLRRFVTRQFGRNDASQEDTPPQSKGEAGDAVDKTEADKPT